MSTVRSAPTPVRAFVALTCAMLIAVRLLMPAGFMPAFEHGRPMIVACPDGPAAAVPIKHHHPGARDGHQPCPYAAAAGLGGTEAAAVALIVLLLLRGPAAIPDRHSFVLAAIRRSRPPPTGPPIPA